MARYALFLLAAASALSGADAGDFDYGAYKPASLAGAIAEHHEEKDPATDFLIDTGNFKYAVVVTYTGQHRETGASAKALIHRWAKALRHPKEYETFFGQELEVESAGTKYWLPIQNAMVQSFASEVRAGTSVKLYILLLGATKEGWVFAINEFQGQ
ncbi:MAG TPA: hypothetical protein VN874_08935 [Myxococcales bacterium]|jgi:hypothetical protein|nr:hypothetical protein [Myxococcales bacterium]